MLLGLTRRTESVSTFLTPAANTCKKRLEYDHRRSMPGHVYPKRQQLHSPRKKLPKDPSKRCETGRGGLPFLSVRMHSGVRFSIVLQNLWVTLSQ